MPPRTRLAREPINDEASTQLHAAPPRGRGRGRGRGRHGRGGRMPEVMIPRARRGDPTLAELAAGMHNMQQSVQQLVNVLGGNRQPQVDQNQEDSKSSQETTQAESPPIQHKGTEVSLSAFMRHNPPIFSGSDSSTIL